MNDALNSVTSYEQCRVLVRTNYGETSAAGGCGDGMSVDGQKDVAVLE
jgi:hypothetical protein